MLSAKTFDLDIRWIEFSDSFIIEFNPLVSSLVLFNIAKIMTKICSTIVHDYTFEFVRELWVVLRYIFLFWKCVRVDIQLLREFPTRVHFFILKAVIVETHTLQMNDEVIRRLLKEGSFGDIAFIFACIALIIRYDFACDILIERLVDIFKPFDFQREWVEILRSLFNCTASWACCLAASLSTENILEYILERSVF